QSTFKCLFIKSLTCPFTVTSPGGAECRNLTSALFYRHGRVPSVVPLPAECYYPSLHRKICLDSHRPITESMLLKILDTFYLRAKALVGDVC
uniref:Uncharacterized protein n=1 Tax=Poecilia latipinna TaxID=48699 RepID=A0A3B3TSW9_9TELE